MRPSIHSILRLSKMTSTGRIGSVHFREIRFPKDAPALDETSREGKKFHFFKKNGNEVYYTA